MVLRQWILVVAWVVLVGFESPVSAYTHGRPALWPARLLGYGWSDGYHAHCGPGMGCGPGAGCSWNQGFSAGGPVSYTVPATNAPYALPSHGPTLAVPPGETDALPAPAESNDTNTPPKTSFLKKWNPWR